MTSRDGAETTWPLAAPATVEMAIGSERPRGAAAGAGATPTPAVTLPVDLPTMLREIETAYINAALAQTRSNKKEAAKLLGMGRTTLVEKLRRRNQAAARAE